MTDNTLYQEAVVEVWWRRYIFGDPVKFIKSFTTYEEAGKFIRAQDKPEYYCLRTVNYPLNERMWSN